MLTICLWLLPLPPHGTVAVADEPTAATSGESAATHEARFERGRNPDDEEAATGKDRLNGEHAADAHDESHGDKLDSGELHGGVSSSPGHEDPVAEVLLAILIILFEFVVANLIKHLLFECFVAGQRDYISRMSIGFIHSIY